jgi:beta-galactosidase
VAEWKRLAPTGEGLSGLWRPEHEGPSELYTLEQHGSTITGSAEGVGNYWAGGNDAPAQIEDGKIDGTKVSFKVAGTRYTGTLMGDWLELLRVQEEHRGSRPNPLELKDKSLAIGPAPDGSDPSGMPSRRQRAEQPFVLRRLKP